MECKTHVAGAQFQASNRSEQGFVSFEIVTAAISSSEMRAILGAAVIKVKWAGHLKGRCGSKWTEQASPVTRVPVVFLRRKRQMHSREYEIVLSDRTNGSSHLSVFHSPFVEVRVMLKLLPSTSTWLCWACAPLILFSISII